MRREIRLGHPGHFLYSDRPIFNPVGGVKGRHPRETWIAAFLMLFAVALFSVNATANPGTYRATFPSQVHGIAFLFLANLPIDAFLFATALYFIYRVAGPDAGRTSKSTSVFIARVLAGSVAIAFIGAMIDFYAFYDKYDLDKYAFWTSHSNAFLGSTEFFLALTGIFASIYAVTFLVVRLDWNLSLLPAITITSLNPIAWIIITSDSRLVALLVGMLFTMFGLASFTVLAHLHRHAFEDETLLGDNIHGQEVESYG
jgi:hypothetical protein